MKQRVVDEIVSTERIYVSDLLKLQQYARAVQEGENAICKASVDAIFSNLDTLVSAQEKFLQELSQELTKPSAEQSLGSFFLEAVRRRYNFIFYNFY